VRGEKVVTRVVVFDDVMVDTSGGEDGLWLPCRCAQGQTMSAVAVVAYTGEATQVIAHRFVNAKNLVHHDERHERPIPSGTPRTAVS
jgi:hypothetical protein